MIIRELEFTSYDEWIKARRRVLSALLKWKELHDKEFILIPYYKNSIYFITIIVEKI